MKKVLTLILISILCLAVVAGLVACNKECEAHVDENGNKVCDTCGENLPDDTPQPPSNNPTTDDNQTPNDGDSDINVVVVPKAEYTREEIGNTTYIYYGELPQTATSIELNNVLVNLVKTNQLTPSDKGYYTYGEKEYACLSGNDSNEGKRLTNGLTMVKDELYFFNVEKIKWRVLEEKEGRALLICESILGEHHFNPAGSYSSNLGTLIGTPNNANDYSVSALRTYVNDTLLNAIFTLRETQSIFDTNVVLRPGESAFTLTQGMYATTVNKMFIPSYWEINEKYNLKVEDSSKVSAVEVKDYQVASGFSAREISGHYYASWWLRTSGERMNNGNIVNYNGAIGTASECSVNLSEVIGIRPMISLRTA